MNHSWVPEESKVVFCSALLSEHADNWYYMYHSKHPAATYAEFRAAFIERFERTEEREDILRDQLRSIRFGGIHKMGDYISRFQKVENQLFNMAYKDRLDHFKSPFPTELRLHLQRLKFKEMDGAYQAAREWAIQGVLEQRKSMKPGGSKHSNPPSGKSTLFRPKLGQEKKEKENNDSEDELDLMDAKQLAGITCYNCRKKGHLSRDCPKPRKPKFDKKKNFKQHAKALYLTQETSGSGEGSDSDNSGTNGDSDDDSDDQLNAIDLYELSEDGDEVNTSSKSEKLPIFNAEVNDEHAAKVILDTGATTVYISEEYVHQIGAEITDIAPRSIRVANREVVQTSGLTKIRMKLGNLSPELITAYVFPLKKIDIILGLPWLKKHNPHVDFRTMSYEFTRNGRRYQLYPAEAPRASKLRVVDAKEFKEFMGDSELYVIHHSDNDDSSEIELLKEKPSGLGKKKRKRFEKTKKWMSEILEWIKGKCPKLLRQIGKPAKLPPFKIDTGDKEPINLRPRPYSPVDLGKIRTFLDENIANGVISESQSPWSAPIVLAKKADGTTRVCVDYRALNQITEKDAHPLPRIDESFGHLGHAGWFTSLDLKSGYWQIPLDASTKPKTAFSTRYGQFQWNVLPFGLTNAPAWFQRQMNQVLFPFIDKFVIVYLDDISSIRRPRKNTWNTFSRC